MRARIKAALAKAWARLLSNVPPGTDIKDLPPVAYRIGRAWQRGPNSFEFLVAWSLDRESEPFLKCYRREFGIGVTFPVIRGRFAVRVIR